MSDLHVLGYFVDAEVIEIMQMVICCITQSGRAFWKKCPFVIVLPPMMLSHPSSHELHHLCHLAHLHDMTELGRHLLSI